MTNWLPVARLVQVDEAVPFGVHIEGIDLVVIRRGETVTVLEGRCPHQGTLLSDGSLQNGVLTCVSHGWKFNTETGRHVANSKICLKTMPSQVDRETILISREALDEWKKATRPHAAVPQGKSYRETKGPRGWPLIGNALDIDRHRLHLILQDWADKFGPLFRFSIGRRQFFGVADADLIQDILRRRPDTFRRISAIEGIFSELGVRGLFSSEGARWRRQRALTMPAFNSSHLQQFMPMMANITGRLQKRWEKAADTGAEVEAQKDLMRYTVDVTTSLAFGHDMNTLETEGDIIQRHLEHLMPAISRRVTAPFPYWRYITTKKDKAAGEALAALKTELENFVVNAKSRMKANPELFQKPTNFLEGLLAGSKEMGGEFTDAELYGNILTILVAGEDTTANSIAWAIYYLLDHPAVQEKMHQEAVANPHFHPDAYPYLEAVANEAMRLKPVGAFLFLEPIEDTTIGEYHVPKGTGVTAILSHPPLQEANFTRPHEFLPERWLPENRAQFPNHNLKAYMPFGAGARFCPGRHLAMTEIKMVLAMMMRNFRLELPASGERAVEYLNFVLVPQGLKAKLIRRNS